MKFFWTFGAFAFVFEACHFCDGKSSREKRNAATGPVIGIDLGTSYSRVAVYKNGRAEILENGRGDKSTPSYVAFNKEGKRLVGEAARDQLTTNLDKTNLDNTIYDVKRFIGRSWDDDFVQDIKGNFPFKLMEEDNKPYVRIKAGDVNTTFAPEEIAAVELGEMKRIGEARLSQTVTRAVITVPSFFNDAQRQATKNAAIIAGFQEIWLIDEAMATAISYGIDQDEEKIIAVVDIGGGKMDASIFSIGDGVFETLATSGDTRLGGEDFDWILTEYLAISFEKQHGKDLRSDPLAVQRLKLEAERAKIHLSSHPEITVEIKSLFEGIDFSHTITRSKFAFISDDLFGRVFNVLKKLLNDHQYSPTKVVLTGGTTRIPVLQSLILNFFRCQEPASDVNRYEAVVSGAAIYGGEISGDGYYLVLPVTAFTVGMETVGGHIATIIPRNTAIPISRTEKFLTRPDMTVDFILYEGERERAEDNNRLGRFTISGIPSGVTNIQVKYSIDMNSILDVSVRGYSHVTIISDRLGLTEAQIDAMIIKYRSF